MRLLTLLMLFVALFATLFSMTSCDVTVAPDGTRTYRPSATLIAPVIQHTEERVWQKVEGDK